jgi:hypothetical protein
MTELCCALREVRQLLFRDGKFREAAIQANQNLGEYQDAGSVQIPEAGEVDVYLGRKFHSIAIRAFRTKH